MAILRREGTSVKKPHPHPKSLLLMVLEDRLPEQNASRPKLLDPRPVAHEPPDQRSSWVPRILQVKKHVERAGLPDLLHQWIVIVAER
jgi:hypothetical protein